MTTLSADNLAAVPRSVARPRYDRDRLGIGIVHIGPGAFHRGHQAVFTEDAVSQSGGDWGISAVSLNSTTAADVAAAQDGLYTLAVKDAQSDYRIVGIIKEGLCARKSPDAVLARLANSDTHIVTLTITEKGYALAAGGGLDMTHKGIAQDIKTSLNTTGAPATAIGYLVRSFAMRRNNGAGPLTVISCDNLPDNGHGLRRACLDFALATDPQLISYIEDNITFPNTMVDSITPAADDALLDDVKAATGLNDVWAVQRERFSQWVIEDNFAGPRPDWDAVGVTITDDVAGFEMAKLRVLNGAHSTLTYMGLLAGIETVREAVEHKALRAFVNDLIVEESLPSFTPPAGLDGGEYWSQTVARFENPHIRHQLSQIAHDGALKIPARIVPVILHHAQEGRTAQRACTVVAAWIMFTQSRRAAGHKVVDGTLDRLDNQLPIPIMSASDYAAKFLDIQAVFPLELSSNKALRRMIIETCEAISNGGILSVMTANTVQGTSNV